MRGVFVVVSLLVLVVLACGSEAAPTASLSPTSTVTTAPAAPTLTATAVPTIALTPAATVVPATARPVSRSSTSASPSSMAISSIKMNPEVVDAAISRQGNEVSMVIMVRSSTNKTRGKELGENFVRMYKSLSDDTAPGRSVGKGKYDYLIGVYYPNEKPLVRGAKVSFADRISW